MAMMEMTALSHNSCRVMSCKMFPFSAGDFGLVHPEGASAVLTGALGVLLSARRRSSRIHCSARSLWLSCCC